MKKLLTKRVLIPLAVVISMAICASAAYAWWTANVTSGANHISTAKAVLTYGGDLPISADGLVPQAAPTGDVAAGGAYKVSFFYVDNSGTTPLNFVGWLDNGIGDVDILGAQVYVKITVAPTDSPWAVAGTLSDPGPWLVYQGPINALYGQAAGATHLNTTDHATPLHVGQRAIYKVVTWLDGANSNNDSQNKSMTCTLKFEGTPVTP